jgi:hypothetical protein
MEWPIDDLVMMEADEVSRWLAARGLPGVTFVFLDSGRGAFRSWGAAGESNRRWVLEAIGQAAISLDSPWRERFTPIGELIENNS